MKSRKNSLLIVIALVCLGLVGGIVFVSTRIKNQKICVNKTETPDLDTMTVQEVTFLTTRQNDSGLYESELSNYDDLCDQLGISLLKSQYADARSMILYQSDGANWITIKVLPFISGDCKKIERAKKIDYYTFEKGETFGSPVDLKIDIITSEQQREIGWDTEYLGYYEEDSVETINGTRVISIVDEPDTKSDIIPERDEVFVYDGILYTLTGHVPDELMRKILESMLNNQDS